MKNQSLETLSIQKTFCACVILVLLLLLGGPFVINVLFKIPANNFFAAEWNAGDALNYYGSLLGFFSTTALSALALWQNHIIKQFNERHTEILERMEREKNAPCIVVQKTVLLAGRMHLTVHIKNISENLAQDLHIFCPKIEDKDKMSLWYDPDFSVACRYLCQNEEWIVEFNNPTWNPNDQFSFSLSYKDKYGALSLYKFIAISTNPKDIYFTSFSEPSPT